MMYCIEFNHTGKWNKYSSTETDKNIHFYISSPTQALYFDFVHIFFTLIACGWAAFITNIFHTFMKIPLQINSVLVIYLPCGLQCYPTSLPFFSSPCTSFAPIIDHPIILISSKSYSISTPLYSSAPYSSYLKEMRQREAQTIANPSLTIPKQLLNRPVRILEVWRW